MPFDNLNQAPGGDLEILLHGRASISDKNSWIQGRYIDGDRRCLVAALSQACGSGSFDMPNRTERRLARLLAKQLPPEAPFWTRVRFLSARHRLMSFNDCPRTAHEDVLSVYDRTISDMAKRVSNYVPA